MRKSKLQLIGLNFLEFAVWGTYQISMGTYLAHIGFGEQIGLFYAIQGIVALLMPTLVGGIADYCLPAQRVLGICHGISALSMLAVGYYGWVSGENVSFMWLFGGYTIGVAFYLPTIGLSYSVAYTIFDQVGMDLVKYYPPIRVFGPVGFIVSMCLVDLLGFQDSPLQFLCCGIIGLLMAFYSFALPDCPVRASSGNTIGSLFAKMGTTALSMFRRREMCLFLVFSMLTGASLQITNGFGNPYLTNFSRIPEYAETFGVRHANLLISLSQISETCCLLLIPYFFRRLGIKRVMQVAMLAWVLRFALFAAGNPGDRVWMFVLSMVVYGMAFDFFNVSGSLYVNMETDPSLRSSAQGVFLMMTIGVGCTVGMLGAQAVVNHFVDFGSIDAQVIEWKYAWWCFSAYALVVLLLFSLLFHPKKPAKLV